MCMGVPMQVVEMRGSFALCQVDDAEALVDMLLVGEQATGTWILNFLGAAREVMTDTQAAQSRAALRALQAVMQQPEQVHQATLDALFADLLARPEPYLPAHLRALVPSPT